jgi:hypothetical protein
MHKTVYTLRQTTWLARENNDTVYLTSGGPSRAESELSKCRNQCHVTDEACHCRTAPGPSTAL